MTWVCRLRAGSVTTVAQGDGRLRWRRVTRPLRCLARRVAAVAATSRRAREAGMATAEYAIATLAACGFAGLLVVILRSEEVRGLLTGIVERALSVG